MRDGIPGGGSISPLGDGEIARALAEIDGRIRSNYELIERELGIRNLIRSYAGLAGGDPPALPPALLSELRLAPASHVSVLADDLERTRSALQSLLERADAFVSGAGRGPLPASADAVDAHAPDAVPEPQGPGPEAGSEPQVGGDAAAPAKARKVRSDKGSKRARPSPAAVVPPEVPPSGSGTDPAPLVERGSAPIDAPPSHAPAPDVREPEPLPRAALRPAVQDAGALMPRAGNPTKRPSQPTDAPELGDREKKVATRIRILLRRERKDLLPVEIANSTDIRAFLSWNNPKITDAGKLKYIVDLAVRQGMGWTMTVDGRLRLDDEAVPGQAGGARA